MSGLKETLRFDLPASVVVFLVAMPLSLGIALASGAPMISGLIAAAVGGVVVGAFSGAPLQVSGPAAGLTVMVFGFIESWGFAVTCLLTVAAGVQQMILGRLGAARVALAISPAVIHGMLAGIGILIALAQLHVVLGGSPQSSALANLRDLPGQILNLHGAATFLGIVTLAILLAWQNRWFLRLQRVPGPLVAVVAATVTAESLGLDAPRIQISGGFSDALHIPSLPPGEWGAIAVAAIGLAVVASAESLLCAVATDKLHTGKRADLDRELFAQGVGNTVSGLIGGLPVTGVIVRSTANVASGARTRASAILHGVWVLAAILFLEPLLSRIPLAALAALLVFVGTRLVNIHHIRRLNAHNELAVYGATVVGILVFGLLAGIGIGVAVAVARLLWRFSHVKVRVTRDPDGLKVTVHGPLTFVGVPKLTSALSQIPAKQDVKIELHSEFLDHAGLDAIESFRESHQRAGGKVEIIGEHIPQAPAA
jgi:carbonic anhydrase